MAVVHRFDCIYLSVFDEQRNEVNVSLVRDVEDDSVFLGRFELDAKVRSFLDSEDSVELKISVLLGACRGGCKVCFKNEIIWEQVNLYHNNCQITTQQNYFLGSLIVLFKSDSNC